MADAQKSTRTDFRTELAELARHHSIIGWERIEHFYHAELVKTAVQAFGADERASFYVESRSGRANIPRPDLILLHPLVGVLVIENKGIKLEHILSVQGTSISLLRDGAMKREDPFHQAEKVQLRLRDLAARRVNPTEAIFLHTAALPRIGREEFEKRFDVHWPQETLFSDAFRSPAVFRAHVLAFVEAQQTKLRRSQRLSMRANAAVCTVLDGKAFLHSPRTIYVENVGPELLGSQIQEMELGLKELTPSQRAHSKDDFRGQHRLFRGVAGSGKSLSLSISAAKTLSLYGEETGSLFTQAAGPPPQKRVLVVCFNRTLVHYLRQRIEDRYVRITWSESPAEGLTVTHFESLVRRLEAEEPALATGLRFDKKAERAKLLNQKFDALEAAVQSRLGFDAIYVDEAQDLLPDELRFLRRLARNDENGRQTLVIFYDNAQNIYGNIRPVWEPLGINIVGRTEFLDQALRNTKELLYLAFNVLVGSFAPEGKRVETRRFADVKSLRDRGLIEELEGRFELHFAPRQGPFPYVRRYQSRRAELLGVAAEIRRLIVEQRVVASDILVLYRSHYLFKDDLLPVMAEAVGVGNGVRQVRKDDASSKSEPLIQDGTLTLSTIASAKGYDAPVVFLLGVDELPMDTSGRASFYVGATRSKLALYLCGIKRLDQTLLDEVVATATALGPPEHVQLDLPAPKEPLEKLYVCRHCKALRLHVQHGKFGYHYVCINCANTFNIEAVCQKCNRKERVRKDGNAFYGECERCKTSRLIHTNVSLTDLT